MKHSKVASESHKTSRRKFVKKTIIATTAMGLNPLLLYGKPYLKNSKKIIIIGAGLAGLTAGYELKKSGHDVTILEAQGRVGGRVLTIREPFSDGLHGQAGGTAFWSFDPDYAMEYIKLFGLEIAKPTEQGGLNDIDYYQNQIVSDIWNTPLEWNMELTADERKMNLRDLQGKYINPTVETFLKKGYPDNPGNLIQEYDRLSVAELFRREGASVPAMELLLSKNFNFLGKDPRTISAFLLFATYSNFRLLKGPFYKVEGGNELLSKAFQDKLASNISLASVVKEINHSREKVVVRYASGDQLKTIEGDYVVSTIPFSVLRNIKVTPPLSSEKNMAINGLMQLTNCPIFLQTKTKFWEKEGYSGNVQTDLPIGYILRSDVPKASNHGLLELFITSETGNILANMDHEARVEYALTQAEKIFPTIRDNFEIGFSKPWQNDPFALGCGAYFRVGEVEKLYPYMAKSEGRVHFAGTHTASLKLWGYMQGAIESGRRVAKELNDR